MPGSSREAWLALGVGDHRRGRQAGGALQRRGGAGWAGPAGSCASETGAAAGRGSRGGSAARRLGQAPAALTGSPLSDGSGTRDQKLRKSPKQINVYCPPDHVVKHSIFLRGNF